MLTANCLHRALASLLVESSFRDQAKHSALCVLNVKANCWFSFRNHSRSLSSPECLPDNLYSGPWGASLLGRHCHKPRARRERRDRCTTVNTTSRKSIVLVRGLFVYEALGRPMTLPPVSSCRVCVCAGALTEVEGHRGVVVRFPVGNEVDLVLPLLLLQPVFGAAVVTHTAAAQDEDDGPDQPEPCKRGETVRCTSAQLFRV